MKRYRRWKARRQYRKEMADAAITFHNEWFCWSVLVSGCFDEAYETEAFDRFVRRFMAATDAADTKCKEVR